MQKHFKWIIVAIVVVVASLVTYNVLTTKEKPFKKVDMKTSNFVLNITGRTYLDTILVTGLKYYGIDSSQVVIRDLPYAQSRIEKGYILKAFVMNEGNQYLLYIIDADKDESIYIIAHELIHFKQYHDKRLQVINDTFIWNGKTYYSDSEYENRPWETEAFGMGPVMELVLKQKLYGDKQ